MAIADHYLRIYAVVRRIPRGRVATYGQIAELAGLEGHARQVGYALHSLRDDRIPWHRVINARGEISPRSAGDSHELQRLLLEAEGVELDVTGRIALERYAWRTDREKQKAEGRRQKYVRRTHGKTTGDGSRPAGARLRRRQ